MAGDAQESDSPNWTLIVVVLAVAVAVLTVVAQWRWPDQFEVGTASGWVAGIGAVAAILIALHEIRAEAQRRRKEEERRWYDLALQREAEARRVWMRVEDLAGQSTDGFRIAVRNDSSNVVHNCFVYMTMGVPARDEREGPQRIESTDDRSGSVHVYNEGPAVPDSRMAILEASIGTLGPGESWSLGGRARLQSSIDVVELSYQDVWATHRWLRHDGVDVETSYGIGVRPPDLE